MTFTRARHNPLSLVILNERRFCASEGPRRAARTGVPIMPAFGVMGWAMPRVLCEALLARLARFLIILLQDALAPITSPFWRSPERSGRGISRYVRGICFSPCLPSTHPAATQKSEHPSPFQGRNNDRGAPAALTPAANATPPDSSPTARTCTQHPDRTSNSCIPQTPPPESHTTHHTAECAPPAHQSPPPYIPPSPSHTRYK